MKGRRERNVVESAAVQFVVFEFAVHSVRRQQKTAENVSPCFALLSTADVIKEMMRLVVSRHFLWQEFSSSNPPSVSNPSRDVVVVTYQTPYSCTPLNTKATLPVQKAANAFDFEFPLFPAFVSDWIPRSTLIHQPCVYGPRFANMHLCPSPFT